MTIGVKKVSLERTAREQIYLPAILEGLLTTARHFFKNTFSKGMGDIDTIRYGDGADPKSYYPERYRGLHRLMIREDGSVRCVACMCCSTVCPAKCIYIVAEDRGDDHEKAPKSFVIDELKCVVCGLCVEACPCDAIRMDTGEHARPVEDRADAIETRETMLARGIPSTAEQGGEGPNWRADGNQTPDGELNR
jgi:NADH-quinone oxidoreductase subunit I